VTGLDGSVKTPFGEMPKKTVVLLGVGSAGIIGVVYYRQKKAQQSSTVSTGTAEIDPATGYPYGSPEDAAALAQQGSYITPTGAGSGATGGGSSSIPPSNISFASNGQWSQAVVEYMTSHGLVQDGSKLSSALGKYIAGQYIQQGSDEDTLVSQAIALMGFPPVAGPNGYPPSINRSPAAVSLGQVSGIHAIRISKNEIALAWTAVPHSRGYDLHWTDAHNRVASATTLDPTYVLANLPSNERYTIQIRAKADTGGTDGPWSTAFVVKTA